MITIANLEEVLKELNFKKDPANIWKKHYETQNCDLYVDFPNKKIIYPKDKGFIVNDETTSNFEKPENFVVLECVDRLLSMGYRAEHIELEKKWTLGHDSKGCKSDIIVYNKDRIGVLIIIECKTSGQEYYKERKNLFADGGQLFSYWQQERSAKWLTLYSSDFDNSKLSYKEETINVIDDNNVITLAKKDTSILLYKNATNAIELFQVWDETYSKRILSEIVFGDESQAYKIGIKPLKKKRLKSFDEKDKIVNKFEEILRHNNVSDKENAFNRLIALFICKLVDEIEKSDEDIVEFQYKVGTDTYETLQDRLQRLHRDGMEKFMREKIEYIADDYAEKLFEMKLNGKERQNAIDDLKKTIRILKFYSNNDFSFKGVHNEELFYQNGKILVEVVELFQPYKIVDPKENQFLGDLFEKLLNKGFKQNEGQFFTPRPITRFIWDSIPINLVTKKGSSTILPKVVDYACGAGHFLTEGVNAINAYFKEHVGEDYIKDNRWTEKCIYGIEKDYRLARVSKVCLYMNGAGDGNIIFGDGLEQYIDKGVENYTFDILVANPPYSVDGFKTHLKLKNNHLDILKVISKDGGEIETVFVERIAQLLRPEGVAAVILPTSILEKGDDSYVAARENIFRNFNIRSIVLLKGSTFSETQTKTAILFLQKYPEPPRRDSLVKDSVDYILCCRNITDWEDCEILSGYLNKIGVDRCDYFNFCSQAKDYSDFSSVDYFSQYIDWFNDLVEIKDLKTEKKFLAKTHAEQIQELNQRFYKKVKAFEWNKLYYFSLIYKQEVLLISAPNDKADEKRFLGYKWSKRKGLEGIQETAPGGKLFNFNNRFDERTLAGSIRKSFSNKKQELDDRKQYYSYSRLQDLIDFQHIDFKKQIKASSDNNIEIESSFAMAEISTLINTLESGSRPSGGVDQYTSGAYSLGGEHIDNKSGELNLKKPKYVPDSFFAAATKGIVKEGDILLCKDGALTGKVALVKKELEGKKAMINEHVFIIRCSNQITQKYLFVILYSPIGQALLKSNVTGAGQGGLNSTNLNKIRIPQPNTEIMKKVVNGYEAIEKEYKETRMSEEQYQVKIGEMLAKLNVAAIKKESSDLDVD